MVLISVVGAAPDSSLELFRMKHAAESALAANEVDRILSAAEHEWPVRAPRDTGSVTTRSTSAATSPSISWPAVVAADRGEATTLRHLPRAALRAMSATIGRVRPELGRQARTALVMDRDDTTFEDHATRPRFADLPCTSATELLR